MKLQHAIGFSVLVFALTLGFSQCAGTKNTMKISDTILISKAMQSQVYYQSWVAGVRGGGSGTDLYVSKSAVGNKELLTAYFNGNTVDFDPLIGKSQVYIARFKGSANRFKDQVMSADGVQEHVNKVPVKKDSIPFKLGVNEAVVSYLENKKIKHIKLTNIIKKEMLAYPSAPRR